MHESQLNSAIHVANATGGGRSALLRPTEYFTAALGARTHEPDCGT